MKNKTLTFDNFVVYLADSSRSGSDLKNAKLKKYLNETFLVIRNFLKSKDLSPLVNKSKNFELGLTICGKKMIKSLNLEHRQKDKVTDVLSFPGHDSLRVDAEDLFIFDKTINFGDIVICREVCLKQSKEFNITYEQELVHLLIHGFLHLCGFDHEISEIEDKIHFSLEEKLVKKVYDNMGIKNARVY
ncbi:rRNA maturation RNase YbeY [Halobacteriovorax sp. HLS]|uniref:rRNA maturation RNase YbeY n=1 Tax=Halobacteriovorax sp. HLS TaxID=2234000 RepID=UPI000FD87C80|nr:rRNA maturation RNase YbeY [Halobacteriovorax sp. HLS]